MGVHEELAGLRQAAGPGVFTSSSDFRAAFDDFVAEASATPGELSLLADAIGTGTFARLLDQLDLGAEPRAAIDSQAQALAAARGTAETAGAGWALAALSFAVGKVDESEVARHVPALRPPGPPTPAPSTPTPPAPAAPRTTLAPPHGPASPTHRPPGRRSPLVPVLSAVAALAVVAAVALAVVLLNREDTKASPRDPQSAADSSDVPGDVSESERSEALAAGRSGAVEIVAVDHARYDAEVDDAAALMTPEFAATYRETAADIRDSFVDMETVVRASAVGTGLVGIDADRATVLVFLNQTVDRKPAETVATPYRVVVSLLRTDGAWLVDGLDTDRAPTEPTEPDPSRQDVIDAATAMAEAFMNFDYRNPDATIDDVLQRSTGVFAEQYRAGSTDLERLAEEAHSTMEADVVGAGVAEFSADRATVIVATRGEVTNDTTGSTPEERNYRLKLELLLVDGEWLTSDLQYVELG